MVKRILFFFCFFLTIPCFQAKSAPMGFSFEKFTYNNQLPSNSVIRIFDDKEGYMWFGTKDGLCRFDGYDMKVFRSSALTPGKLSNNEIQCIVEDNDQQLWVGTYEGINIIDKKSYSIRQLDNDLIKKERINSILPDSKGYIWIATSNNGVLCMNQKTGEFKHYSIDKDSPLKLKSNNVSNIYEDNDGRIWISSWKSGLCYIDKNQTHISYLPKIGINDNPFRIYQDKSKIIWICTWGDGIFNIDNIGKPTMSLHPINLSRNSGSRLDDIVYSITQDNKYGYIWVITFSGLNLIEKEADGTYKLVDTGSFFNETSNKLFHEIVKDHRGNLWLGSVGDGLYKLDFNKPPIQNYPLNEIKSSLNAQSYVTRFCETKSGNIYIAINRIGLFLFNPKTGLVTRPIDGIARSLFSVSSILYNTKSDEIWVANEGEDVIHIFKTDNANILKQTGILRLNSNATRENTISSLFEDSKGNVWIGSYLGLYQKPLNAPLKLISAQIHHVNAIKEDAEQNILVGTDKDGLFLLKVLVQGIKRNIHVSKINLSINNAYQSLSIQSICCKKNGDVYVGTNEGCIYYYNKQNKTATDISGRYGISDEGIFDIQEDNYGFLWISTIKRIIRYNPQTHAATYFSNNDGLLVSSFFKDASIKLKSGQILFGGNKGISAFDPVNLSTTTKPIKQHVAITDILIQNKSIFDDASNSHFDAEKKRVTLKYSENNLSIEFSALDYSTAGKIQYAYRLSGVDHNWNYVGNNRRFVNYANLPDGEYEFNVKASDENGLWSDKITTLDVVIKPPFYRSWLAYLLYLIAITASIYFVARAIANRIRLRNELKISHIEKEKSEELAQTKLRYFTNISHELLTPLTIIMLLIESLQQKNKEDSAQFEIMKDTVLRLKRLIQQILVFRKTETGNMKLKIVKNDIVAFVNNICQSNFRPLVAEKEIHFSFDVEHESYMAYFDPDKLDKIIYNLLSNAFKHTPKGGTIALKMSMIPRNEETILRLSVSDTGDGIAEEDLPHIFKRFYISSSSDQSQSHGIGLALTSDLLQLHKGKIEVKSQLNEGAVFTIEIPISMGAYTEQELLSDDAHSDNQPEIPDVIDPSTTFILDEESDKIEDYSILVVEDNKDLRNIITDYFARKCRVFSAENGLRALEIISDNEIDLIVCDVMMPEMDGLTLCRKIKNDIATSHINMLMLTAKNSTEDRIDCYNAGADAYIAKPFELAVLNARVKNLIGKRIQKTDKFQHTHEINISSMEYNSIDEVFLQQAVKKVEEKMADETFDFDQFSIDMSTSKSTLHRKLKSLTGLSPGEFIRNIRLKHAAIMLTNNIGNVSEIAYAVGFNDPKYFSRCFKIEFGLTPKEYQEGHKNKQ
jgi:signal transduction histidine kinase/ligand-binding sensor domain-containing protein/DNA-binding response OmpR family regulator